MTGFSFAQEPHQVVLCCRTGMNETQELPRPAEHSFGIFPSNILQLILDAGSNKYSTMIKADRQDEMATKSYVTIDNL